MRLAESTGKVLSDAQVTLSFYIDPQKLVVMKGQVQVDVELECQRCGEPFKQTLECHFMYSPVANWDQADDLPEIYEPVTFLHAVQDKIPSLITYEAEETHTVSWGLEKLCAPKRLRVYVGPAGGWTDEEIVIAAQYGILPITLGVNILRAETACIAAAAKIL